MTPDQIESIAIHPAIGIARIGNSEHGYFLAPDVIGETPKDDDGYRDEEGRIKRQVARFGKHKGIFRPARPSPQIRKGGLCQTALQRARGGAGLPAPPREPCPCCGSCILQYSQ